MAKREKLEIIKALDVVPGKIYLVRTDRNTWYPCTVYCSKTHGWQRGYVEIVTGMHQPIAQATYAGSNKVVGVYVNRVNDQWIFSDNSRRPTLAHLTKEWLDTHIGNLNREIGDLMRQRELLLNVSLGSTILANSVQTSTDVVL